MGERQKDPTPIAGLAAARIYLALLRDPLSTFERMAERHGPVAVVGVPFRPGARRIVFAFGRDANRAVLSDPDTFRTTGQGLSGPRGSALRRIRNGMTRSRGERHRELRARLLPALARRSVEAMAPRIGAIVDEALSHWRPGTTIDLGRETKALSLRVASELLFGVGDWHRAQRLGSLLGEFMRRSYRLDVLATRWLGALPGTPYASLEGLARTLDREARALIAARRAAMGQDLLSLLIAAQEEGTLGLDEDDLVGQFTLLFGASYETTAQALLFSLVLLAQSPEEALALRAASAGEHVPGVGTQALANVVRESLRLLPPVPYTIRIARCAAQIGGVGIRRSDRVLVSHFHAHRLAECFSAPERFTPARWRGAAPGPYEYFPFSAAPRLCIGAGFATEVLEQAVGEVVRRFDFQLPDGLRIDPAVRVTLGPRGVVPLRLDPPGHGMRRARLSGGLGRRIEAATREETSSAVL